MPITVLFHEMFSHYLQCLSYPSPLNTLEIERKVITWFISSTIKSTYFPSINNESQRLSPNSISPKISPIIHQCIVKQLNSTMTRNAVTSKARDRKKKWVLRWLERCFSCTMNKGTKRGRVRAFTWQARRREDYGTGRKNSP